MIHTAKDTTVSVQFRTLVDQDLLVTFQIKLVDQAWDDVDVQSSDCMRAAVTSFLHLHQLWGDAKNAPAFFGISCPAVQLLVLTLAGQQQVLPA